jgi:hypothetical protein
LLPAPPAAQLFYHIFFAGTHLGLGMVEVGKSWATLFKERIVTPLGLDPDTVYYALPKQQLGQLNPLLAGGSTSASRISASSARC